jgi:YHS domain-containing protein
MSTALSARLVLRPLAAAGALAASLILAPAAWAGPQYVEDGYALSGYDPVAYFTEDAAVRGDEAIAHEYNGATWLFSSEAHRDLFAADPEAYAPAYDGHCAYGVAQGAKVPGDPELWGIVDGRLFVNLNDRAQALWLRDVPGNLAQADETWPGVEPDPAANPR